jgi:membrane protein implicated in regulation of membrane protease activity
MPAWLGAIEFWWWWTLGAALLAVEILAPGFFFLWFAASAVVVGFLLLALPDLGWGLQLVLFAVLGVAALAIGRPLFRRPPPQSDHPTLSRRGEAYVGRQLTLTDPIRDGVGWAKVDDSRWRVAGPDLPAGSHVRVVGVQGTTLQVEPAR